MTPTTADKLCLPQEFRSNLAEQKVAWALPPAERGLVRAALKPNFLQFASQNQPNVPNDCVGSWEFCTIGSHVGTVVFTNSHTDSDFLCFQGKQEEVAKVGTIAGQSCRAQRCTELIHLCTCEVQVTQTRWDQSEPRFMMHERASASLPSLFHLRNSARAGSEQIGVCERRKWAWNCAVSDRSVCSECVFGVCVRWATNPDATRSGAFSCCVK